MKDILIKNINDHLVSCGFSQRTASSCAYKGWQHFEKSICNSRDPYKDACDHAGEQAKILEPKVKYKSPKSKSRPRTKKPQEVFKF